MLLFFMWLVSGYNADVGMLVLYRAVFLEGDDEVLFVELGVADGDAHVAEVERDADLGVLRQEFLPSAVDRFSFSDAVDDDDAFVGEQGDDVLECDLVLCGIGLWVHIDELGLLAVGAQEVEPLGYGLVEVGDFSRQVHEKLFGGGAGNGVGLDAEVAGRGTPFLQIEGGIASSAAALDDALGFEAVGQPEQQPAFALAEILLVVEQAMQLLDLLVGVVARFFFDDFCYQPIGKGRMHAVAFSVTYFAKSAQAELFYIEMALHDRSMCLFTQK